MLPSSLSDLAGFDAPIGYFVGADAQARAIAWPFSSGRKPEMPPKQYFACTIRDCRSIAGRLDLDHDGFLLREQASSFAAPLDDERVESEYYPEVAAFVRELTGATAAFVFDHIVRSAEGGGTQRRPGVHAPVDMAHVDYTAASGVRRTREILEALRYDGPTPRRTLLVNVWRPLHGPVVDQPLAICHAPSVRIGDLVPTSVQHYSTENDPATPAHSGVIFTLRHDPRHRWFYTSAMQPYEVLVFKQFDSDEQSMARFTPHTGFVNPNRPAQFRPRESIEVRVLVVDPR